MINIINKASCVGCEACRQICPKQCITMVYDNEGFSYPMVSSKDCIKCSLCEKVCPIIQYGINELRPNNRVFAVKHQNHKVQFESTSGGAFTAIANWAELQNGIIFGAAYDEQLNVIHCKAKNTEEYVKFRGSKYVQSLIGNTFIEIRELLTQGKLVLFSGTPCQVSGLKLFLLKPYSNLYTVDIICHGVPSPKVFKDYINFIQKKGKLLSINMRYKAKGWNASEGKIIYANGKKIVGSGVAGLWRKLYSSRCITRPCCYECKFTNFNRQGDITIGDYWGIEKSHPNFFDNNGISLLLLNSAKGNYIFENIKNELYSIESSREKCLQPMLYESVRQPLYRDLFWEDYGKFPFKKVAKKYGEYGIISQIKIKYKYILCIIKIIKKKFI